MASDGETKKVWTDEERNVLAEKMDREMDDFLNNLAAQKREREKDKPKKEFNYDEWEKEISQHPAFMTKLPDDGNSEYNEYIEAIRALKYDVGDTPEEIILDAEQHKTNGNKHFKLKKYRWACEEYSNGIKLKPSNLKLLSQLYGNRAAANYEIGNNRSCQRDCVWALRLDPTNFKCIIRMTRSLLNVDKVYEAKDWLEKNLEYVKNLKGEHTFPNHWNEDCSSLQEEIAKKILVKERDARKERILLKKKVENNEKYLKAFKQRDLKFIYPSVNVNNADSFDLESLEVNISQMSTKECVTFDDDGKTLLWPILFQYPEIALTDVMKSSNETTVFEFFIDSLSQNWLEETPWSIYKFGDVIVTFECGKTKGCLYVVNLQETLSKILSKEELFIKGGLPVFQIYTKNYFDKNFICKKKNYYQPK
ncbi:Tetratricopeptide repeat protein 4 [Strongyloides ratti]|uniref:Tetratricopeptide repeat protein 4 n=1 Tax=Strongyloides ratti TaxID=34506 RepID=A0A090MYL4_STRRB|nr:Tetratricopeptide repeat protein 4 [Strongyloides ratti]CEF67389.1 Tetratricopeptide repeat protein 4 [Strongyloides ratti]